MLEARWDKVNKRLETLWNKNNCFIGNSWQYHDLVWKGHLWNAQPFTHKAGARFNTSINNNIIYVLHSVTTFRELRFSQQQILPPPCRYRRCCGSHSKGRSTWVSAYCRARRCADPGRPLPEVDRFPFYSKTHWESKQSFAFWLSVQGHQLAAVGTPLQPTFNSTCFT